MARLIRLLIAVSAFICISTASVAQEYTLQSTGAIFATPEDLAGVPTTPTFRAFLPERFDLSMSFPPVGDQKEQGSCVGWAVGYAARSYYAASHEGREVTDRSNVPSPAYIYNSITQSRKCDRGSRVIDALNLLKKGAVSLSEFPYSDKSCALPSDDIVSKASDFRITSWSTVNYRASLDQVKGELVNGNPVVISVVTDFALHALAGTDVWRSGPPTGAEDEGGHAITVVGYDDRDETFKIINSWGTGWGDRGYGYISYATFRQRVKEAYVMAVPEKVAPIPLPRPSPETFELPANLTCASISKSADAVIGFVSTPADQAVIDDWAKQRGLSSEVQLRPWPQCEILITLHEELAAAQGPTVSLSNDRPQGGDQLVVNVETPDFDGYVHVAYVQADGSVATLEQVSPTSFAMRAPKSNLVFGDGEEGRASFTVGPPFGNEMVVALTSKSPLFAEPRPTLETEREFLTALRLAILKKEQSGDDEQRVVTAAAIGLVTVPAKKEGRECVERALSC